MVNIVMLPFVLTTLAAIAPVSADEQTIIQDCLDRGASEAECACGVEQARSLMSAQEIGLLADLVPAMSSATDMTSALEMVPAALERNGIARDQFAPVLAKVLQFGSIVEQSCAEQDQAAP